MSGDEPEWFPSSPTIVLKTQLKLDKNIRLYNAMMLAGKGGDTKVTVDIIRAYIKFMKIGVMLVCALFAAYKGFLLIGMGETVAISICYLVGVVSSIALNKKWTFNVHRSGLFVAIALIGYVFSGLVCIALNHLVLINLSQIPQIENLAFFVAAIAASISNFVVSQIGAFVSRI